MKNERLGHQTIVLHEDLLTHFCSMAQIEVFT